VIEDYDLTNLFRRPVPHLFGPETPQEVTAMLLSAQPKYLEAAFGGSPLFQRPVSF
jgi:hypothetical protein